MTVQAIYADTMRDVRAWLRTHPYLTALTATDGTSLLNARVFFRIPNAPSYPLVRIYEINTVNQDGDAPIVDTMIGIDVWGGDYQQVADITLALRAAFHLMAPDAPIGATTIGLNADVIGSVDSPDPDTGRPRKVLTALLTSRARAAGE